MDVKEIFGWTEQHLILVDGMIFIFLFKVNFPGLNFFRPKKNNSKTLHKFPLLFLDAFFFRVIFGSP